MSDEEDQKPWGDLIVARINEDGYADVRIAAHQMEDPYDFGRFLADVARHGALAFSTTWSLDESNALEQICEGLSDQLREQETRLIKVQDGSLDS